MLQFVRGSRHRLPTLLWVELSSIVGNLWSLIQRFIYASYFQAGSNLKAARFLVKQVFIFFQEFGREYIIQNEPFNEKRFNNHFYICQGVYSHKVTIPKTRKKKNF